MPFGLEICKPCLVEESGDSGDAGIVPGNVYEIVMERVCTSMRHQDKQKRLETYWTCENHDHTCRENDIVCGCRCDGCADDGEPRCDRCNVVKEAGPMTGVYQGDPYCPDCRPDDLIEDEPEDDGEVFEGQVEKIRSGLGAVVSISLGESQKLGTGPCYCAVNEGHDGVCQGPDCNCHGTPSRPAIDDGDDYKCPCGSGSPVRDCVDCPTEDEDGDE